MSDLGVAATPPGHSDEPASGLAADAGSVPNAVTLRDWFATHCPDSWLEAAMPKTIGATRDELLKRHLIPQERSNWDVLRAYNEADVMKLRVALRWEYADAMLVARRTTRARSNAEPK